MNMNSFRLHSPTLLPLLMLVCTAPVPCSSQVTRVEKERDILRAEDLRDAPALQEFFWADAAALRARAAVASGSVQDTSHMAALIALGLDQDAGVRRGAAFALGQMGFVIDSVRRAELSDFLLRRFAAEGDTTVLVRIIEALGKAGDAGSLGTLISAASHELPDPVKGEISLAVGRYAYRGIRDQAATDYVMRYLDLSSGPERWKAAYAVMRIGDKEMLDQHASRIAAAAQSPDPDVRMFVSTALGNVVEKKVALLTLLKLAAEEKDWRVRVNVLKALASADLAANEDAGIAVLQAVEDSSEHVSLTALEALGRMKGASAAFAAVVRTTLTEVLRNAGTRYTGRQVRGAALSLARLLGERGLPLLREEKQRGSLSQESYVDALSLIPVDDTRLELCQLVHQKDARIVRSALEALTLSCKTPPVSAAAINRIRGTLTNALGSKEAPVVAMAAEALGDSLFATPASAAELLGALRRMRSPKNTEEMTAIIRTLGVLKVRRTISNLITFANDQDPAVAKEAALALLNITGKPYLRKTPVPAVHANFDWALLTWLSSHPDVYVTTSRGSFTLRLLPGEAPMTCINMATLVRKGFYDGLTFHRVVPNFVVQGGDPRGDGWGGPGYSIRSEFGMEHYSRGTAGLASSGKDTEGSQFFITHSNQPHLDGRYTVFGRVVDGLDVVDRLQIGDRIETMKLEPGGEMPK